MFMLRREFSNEDLKSTILGISKLFFAQYLGTSYNHASSFCSGGARIPTLTLGYPNLPTKGATASPKNSSFSKMDLILKTALFLAQTGHFPFPQSPKGS